MTKTECNQWWQDFQAKFPSVGKWAATLTEIQWREVFAAWEESLSSVRLADALEVNRLMRSGVIAEVGTFDSDREKIGFVVRSEADNLARSRRPKIPDDWEHDRVKCVHCRDTGLVECFKPTWHLCLAAQSEIPASFKDARDAGWKGGRPTKMVFCSCPAGDALIWRGPIEKKPAHVSKSRVVATGDREPPRYNADAFYRVHGNDLNPSEWSKAVAWFCERGEAATGQRVYDEFEAWNDQPPRETVEFKRP
jgi:hypothetical protein